MINIQNIDFSSSRPLLSKFQALENSNGMDWYDCEDENANGLDVEEEAHGLRGLRLVVVVSAAHPTKGVAVRGVG